jgi:hypothetical protein
MGLQQYMDLFVVVCIKESELIIKFYFGSIALTPSHHVL